MTHHLTWLLLLLLVNTSTGAQESVGWTHAIVRLEVPLTRRDGNNRYHYREDCTGTIVGAGDVAIIATAWHCFDGTMDLTQQIKVSNPWLNAYGRLLRSGGSMVADWALVLADVRHVRQVASMPLLSVEPSSVHTLSLAGYARKPTQTADDSLTVLSDCSITGIETQWTATRCVARKGASGGPALYVDANTGEKRFAGVISSGNGVDTSYFVPLSAFRTELHYALRKYIHR